MTNIRNLRDDLVSVIIPTFNRSERLGKAIDSVLHQTYNNIEIIIVDDNLPGSDERKATETLINEKYKLSQLIYIKHDYNKGGSAARNTGINYAKGDYIAFLDDDDIWDKDKTRKQLNVFYNEPDNDLGLVYCHRYAFDEKGNIIHKKKANLYQGWVFEYLLVSNFIATPVALVKRECFNKVGLFDENLLSRQDHDMFLRISKHYKVQYIDEFLAGYLVHKERISRNINKKINGWELFLNKWQKELLPEQKIIQKKIFHYEMGKVYLTQKEFKKGRNHLLSLLKIKEYNIKIFILIFLSYFRINIIK